MEGEVPKGKVQIYEVTSDFPSFNHSISTSFGLFHLVLYKRSNYSTMHLCDLPLEGLLSDFCEKSC